MFVAGNTRAVDFELNQVRSQIDLIRFFIFLIRNGVLDYRLNEDRQSRAISLVAWMVWLSSLEAASKYHENGISGPPISAPHVQRV